MNRKVVRPVAAVALVASMLTVSGAGLADEADASSAGAGAQREWLASAAGPKVTSQGEGTAWRTLGALLGLSALGGAVLWARRRKTAVLAGAATPRLDVVSSAKVGPKSQVVLTRVGGRLLLLGVTDASVRRLAWLPDDAAPAAKQAEEPEAGVVELPAPANDIGRACAEGPRPEPGFADILRTALGRPPAAPVSARAVPPSPVVEDDAAEPAVALAESVRDVVRPMGTIRRPRPVAAPSMLDVEDQAAGLAALLAKRRPVKRRAAG